MAAEEEVGSTPSRPRPRPRSPPRYPDFCGRHRLQAEVQLLSREIGFLEEELQSVGRLQPVSVCCKQVDEYVGEIPDPLIPTFKKRKKSFWLWRCLRAIVCLSVPPGSCYCRCCSCRSRKRRSCTCKPSWSCPSSSSSSSCCTLPCRSCCFNMSCSRMKCAVPRLSCPAYSCGCVCSCSNCTKACSCSRGLCCIS